jgi:hypothetical protein
MVEAHLRIGNYEDTEGRLTTLITLNENDFLTRWLRAWYFMWTNEDRQEMDEIRILYEIDLNKSEKYHPRTEQADLLNELKEIKLQLHGRTWPTNMEDIKNWLRREFVVQKPTPKEFEFDSKLYPTMLNSNKNIIILEQKQKSLIDLNERDPQNSQNIKNAGIEPRKIEGKSGMNEIPKETQPKYVSQAEAKKAQRRLKKQQSPKQKTLAKKRREVRRNEDQKHIEKLMESEDEIDKFKEEEEMQEKDEDIIYDEEEKMKKV